jgi:serine/threonine protein kinase
MEIANFVPRGYEIIRFLGSGGTASVYLARRKADGRMFALKAPLLTDSPLSLSVFRALVRREYKLINKANYSGLVRIYDLDETDDSHPFLVMEYCPGKSLDRFDRILSPDILLNILSSISINLFFVHISGIYHGDLKPHNIFLTGDPESYRGPNHIYSKLSDFSLALKADELLPARLGMGTVGYMAPETIERNTFDFRSDIFALGVIGYKLATGQHPFWPEGEKTDPVRISAAITEFQPSPPEQIRSSLPAGLSELIMQMLAKDPQKRPENAYAICEQLERAGASYPFRKMISPKHLISVAKTSVNSDFLKAPFWDISGNQIKAMLDLVGDDTSYLRHVVQINFVSGKIVWQGGKLRVVENDLIWPNNIKRRLGEIFGKLPLHLKKKAIQAAIIGELRSRDRSNRAIFPFLHPN